MLSAHLLWGAFEVKNDIAIHALASAASHLDRVGREHLPDASLAYTTVATMLRKMENRRLVRHRRQERRFIYEPAVTEDEVTRSMAHDLVDRLFEGSAVGTMSHLLTTREVSRDELAELEQLIEQRKKQS